MWYKHFNFDLCCTLYFKKTVYLSLVIATCYRENLSASGFPTHDQVALDTQRFVWNASE